MLKIFCSLTESKEPIKYGLKLWVLRPTQKNVKIRLEIMGDPNKSKGRKK